MEKRQKCYNGFNMNIDIERLKEIKDELDAMNESDVLFIDEDRKAKYVIMPVELYDTLEDLLNVLNAPAPASVRIAAPEEFDLSYDEYERIKKQIMEAVEKTFMPKPEKLN